MCVLCSALLDRCLGTADKTKQAHCQQQGKFRKPDAKDLPLRERSNGCAHRRTGTRTAKQNTLSVRPVQCLVRPLPWCNKQNRQATCQAPARPKA